MNGDNYNNQNIYGYMARLSDNDKIHNIYFCDNSQSTNWILDSGATSHITPQVSGFIPSSLEDKDKHIEVENRHHITEKQKVQVIIIPFVHLQNNA